jgi:hypothetical protein
VFPPPLFYWFWVTIFLKTCLCDLTDTLQPWSQRQRIPSKSLWHGVTTQKTISEQSPLWRPKHSSSLKYSISWDMKPCSPLIVKFLYWIYLIISLPEYRLWSPTIWLVTPADLRYTNYSTIILIYHLGPEVTAVLSGLSPTPLRKKKYFILKSVYPF